MKVTLTDSAVAYDLFDLVHALDKAQGRSVQSLAIQVPLATDEAANAGAIVKVGPGNLNTSPTDVTSPQKVLKEGDDYPLLVSQGNGIGLPGLCVKANVANCVLYLAYQSQ